MTHHDARAEMKRPERPVPEDERLERHDRNGGEGHGGHQGYGKHGDQGDQMQGMATMAEQVTRHYDTPTPHSHWLSPDPFPPAVMRGLALGAALGAIVGALAGYLLANSILVVPGWELMYSGAPATIYTLWTLLGVALGVATVGVGTTLAARVEPAPEHDAPRHGGHLPASAAPPERERMVGEQ